MNADPQTVKRHAQAQWDRSAQGWNEHTPQIRDWLRSATDAMLDMAAIRPGAQVLDVAAGAGDQTADIARRVGPTGRVLATDLSPAMLALAQSNAIRAGLGHVATMVADGEELPVEAGSFDNAVCRLGLMLFPDPVRAVRALYRALRPGGGVCVMVFGRPEHNPCVTTLMRTALKHAGLPPPDPAQPGGLLSLGRPGRLDVMFQDAGFRDIASTTVDAPFRLPSVRHYLDFVRSSASPIQQILGRLEATTAQAAWDDIEARLATYQTADAWVGPNELLLTAARR